jgi:deoxycytidylate deaminase
MDFDSIIRGYITDALEHNKYNKSCHIAVLLDRKKVVSYGFNQMDRQCFRGKAITSLHAEIDCLRKLRPISSIKKKYKLLVIKVSRHDFTYTDSMPCDCCTRYIKGVGLNSVYASNENGKIEKINLETYNPVKITYQISPSTTG